MGHTVNFWRVLDSRTAAIRNLIWKRWVLHVRNVVRRLYTARQKRADDITDAKVIRNAILCHGRNHLRKNVRSVEGTLLEKGNKLVCADEQCGYVEQKSSDN